MQQIQISPLQVEKYFLAELVFQVKNEIEEAEVSLDSIKTPEIGITANTVEIDSESRKWKCELIIQTKDKENAPYNFRIVLVGFFKISLAYKAEMVEQLANFNCPSILYSTAREMLTATIRRSPFPPVMLPSVVFSPSVNEEKEAETQTKKRKSRKESGE
jgi:preprotein translocase subunit SecB